MADYFYQKNAFLVLALAVEAVLQKESAGPFSNRQWKEINS